MTKLGSLFIFACFIISCESPTKHEDVKIVANKNIEATDHLILGEEVAREQLKKALLGKGQNYTLDTIIKKSSIAIAIAEPILFEVYGKQQIISERPYEVYFMDGYWYLSGTIAKGTNGGAFEIILSARNGEIIRLTHYK